MHCALLLTLALWGVASGLPLQEIIFVGDADTTAEEDSTPNFHLLVPFVLDDSYSVSELTAARPHVSAVGPRDPLSPPRARDTPPSSLVIQPRFWDTPKQIHDIPSQFRDTHAVPSLPQLTPFQMDANTVPARAPPLYPDAGVNRYVEEPFSDIPSSEFTLDSETVKKDLSAKPAKLFPKYHSLDEAKAGQFVQKSRAESGGGSAARWIDAMCGGEAGHARSPIHHEHSLCGLCCVIDEIGHMITKHYDTGHMRGRMGQGLIEQLTRLFSGRRDWAILNSQYPNRNGVMLA